MKFPKPNSNSKEARNGGRYNLIPFEEGTYLFRLRKIRFVEGYEVGQAYVADVFVTESTNANVPTGVEYNLLFPIAGKDKTQQQYKDAELRMFMCALCKEDQRNENFDSDQEVIDLAEAFYNAKDDEESMKIAEAFPAVRGLYRTRDRTKQNKGPITTVQFAAS